MKQRGGREPLQFTRADLARVVVGTANAVLEALHNQQVVEKIVVRPTGEGIILVELDMCDRSIGHNWKVLATIPPSQKQTDTLL